MKIAITYENVHCEHHHIEGEHHCEKHNRCMKNS